MIERQLSSLKHVLLLVFISICLNCCTKTSDPILFKMEYDQILNIPAGLNTIETYSFLVKDIPSNYRYLLTTFNFTDTTITTIKPGSIRLIDELGLIDFSRVEKISLIASQSGYTNEKEIGYLELVPLTSTNTLQLFPTLVNAKDIFSKETFNLKLKIKLRNFLNTSANIRLRFNMNAN